MKALKSQQGFTLIELMLVVLIIGTLSSIAIPLYQGYTARTKVIEGLALSTSAKTAVSENAVQGVTFSSGWVAPFPTSVVSADPTGVSRLVADTGVKIDDVHGEITITYTNKIALGSPTLLLVPADGTSPLEKGKVIGSDTISWQCNSANPPLDNVLRDRRGTIDPKFVPTDCRS